MHFKGLSVDSRSVTEELLIKDVPLSVAAL